MIAFAIGAVLGFLLGVWLAPPIYVMHAEWIGHQHGEREE